MKGMEVSDTFLCGDFQAVDYKPNSVTMQIHFKIAEYGEAQQKNMPLKGHTESSGFLFKFPLPFPSGSSMPS